MNKTQHIREIAGFSMGENGTDLRDLPMKESLGNLGLGLLLALIAALNIGLSLCQLTVSVLALGYDLITKGLSKVMPKPVANSKS